MIKHIQRIKNEKEKCFDFKIFTLSAKLESVQQLLPKKIQEKISDQKEGIKLEFGCRKLQKGVQSWSLESCD